MMGPMLAILHSLGMFIVDLSNSRHRLEAENLVLRHQLGIVSLSETYALKYW
jgi:hypothetical protein